MDPLSNPETREEAVQRWLKENGSALITGVLLGIGVLLGWQFWQSYTDNRVGRAGLEYDRIQELAGADQVDQATALVDRIMDTYSGTAYASLAALLGARLSYEQGDAEASLDYFDWVIARGFSAEVKDLARVRKAAVLYDKGEYDQALAGLDPEAYPQALEGQVHALRGDVFSAQGQIEAARDAYEAALAAAGPVPDVALLELKLEQLASVDPTRVVARSEVTTSDESDATAPDAGGTSVTEPDPGAPSPVPMRPTAGAPLPDAMEDASGSIPTDDVVIPEAPPTSAAPVGAATEASDDLEAGGDERAANEASESEAAPEATGDNGASDPDASDG